ncbi:Imm21 family immunity protein [Streptomyces sp. NPDC003016]
MLVAPEPTPVGGHRGRRYRCLRAHWRYELPLAHRSRYVPPLPCLGVWAESMGGPLIVIPVSALDAWRGCTGSGMVAGGGCDRCGRLRQGLCSGRSGRRDRRW